MVNSRFYLRRSDSSTTSTSSSSDGPLRWDPTSENIAWCLAAMRGESVPHSLLIHSLARQAVIYGIRHHDAFANSLEIVKLCTAPENKDLARARHARLIMSNIVPGMDEPALFPYCIWYPDLATANTYRKLAYRYPAIRYQVGRACAVAGYTELYRELDLLPDTSIAEEARDNTESGQAIFTNIINSTIKYTIMNDYTRTINLDNPIPGAYLNGDTAVHSMLADGSYFEHYAKNRTKAYFDITEDGNIADKESSYSYLYMNLQPEEVQWLYKPLPRDLPFLNKDLLILMAAYEGNVDRYVRLQRPFMIEDEPFCILRGIYHHTMFAKWWSEELQDSTVMARVGPERHTIKRAIIARFIMCNDLSLAMASPEAVLPYMIWYPLWPREVTLADLARRRPEMRPAVAHACIVADYQKLYDKLQIEPDPVLYQEARNSSNEHYKKDLERRAEEKGIDITRFWRLDWPDTSRINTAKRDKEPTISWLHGTINSGLLTDGTLETVYDRVGCQAMSNKIDLFICSPVELRKRAAEEEGGWKELYENDWPA